MTCPVCSKDSDPKYRPFCCRRCADIDLGRWLTGSYAIPAEEVDPDDPALQSPGDSPTQPKRPQ